MGSLYGALISTADSMRVFERALNTVQNNVVNVNSPGYAKQVQGLNASRFEPEVGIIGGVKAGSLQSYRDVFAERGVQRRASQSSLAEEKANRLSTIQSNFPIAKDSGLPAAFNRFFNSVSQLTVSPNDASARQVTLNRASDVATEFRRTANQLIEDRGDTQAGLINTVNGINNIIGRVKQLNATRSGGENGFDPGSEAQLYSSLEELSGLVDFNFIKDPDGAVSLYLGGQSLVVISDREYPITTDVFEGQARILDSEGIDITNRLSGGKLGGLLDTYNDKLPTYQSDLDTLAASFADQVNFTLAGGLNQDDIPPTQDLFRYDATLGAAYTLATNGLGTRDLALAGLDEPKGNANAIALSGLAQARSLNNQSFTEYYGTLAGGVGRDLSNAKAASTVQGDLLTQARELRQTAQGVDLNEEAARLIQYQRAYQAAGELFRTINSITESVLSVLR
jgi:flagellar hook-associated protein 1